jgi:hypothetical protein
MCHCRADPRKTNFTKAPFSMKRVWLVSSFEVQICILIYANKFITVFSKLPQKAVASSGSLRVHLRARQACELQVRESWKVGVPTAATVAHTGETNGNSHPLL